MQEVNFRASDNNPLASVNVSEDSTFNIPPNEISDVGTFIFGGKLMMDDGNFVIGESDTVPLYLTAAMLPFAEMDMELTYEENWLDITEGDIMIVPQYIDDLTIASQISSGYLNITVYNDSDIVLDGDIIQLAVTVGNNAPAGYTTAIHFQETSAIRGNDQIMLGNTDGTFCFVSTDSAPDIVVESDDIDIALYPGEDGTEIISHRGASTELSGVTINIVNAPDTTLFSYSPTSDTLSACQGSMVNLEFYAHPDSVGTYPFEMLFVTQDVAQDTMVKTDTLHVDFEILQPDFIVQPGLIQAVVDSGETTQKTLTIQGKGGIAEFILTKPDTVNWVEVSPDSGSITGDETIPITLTFNETSHAGGFYESDLTVLVKIVQDYVPTDTVHVELTINDVIQFIEHPEILHIQNLISKLDTFKNIDEGYDPAYDEDNDGDIDMEDLKAIIRRWGE